MENKLTVNVLSITDIHWARVENRLFRERERGDVCHVGGTKQRLCRKSFTCSLITSGFIATILSLKKKI